MAVGKSLTISGSVAETQGTSIINQGGFFPQIIEAALDRLTILIQQLRELSGRSLSFPVSDSTPNSALPTASVRANNLLAFDASGNPTVVAPSAQSSTALSLALANATGAGLVGFSPLAGGPQGATVQAALAAAAPIVNPLVVVASAATTPIGAANSSNVTISGVAAITAFDNATAGTKVDMTFSGAATLTHHAVSLIIPGGVSIMTTAGDTAAVVSLGGGNWRLVRYQRASGAGIDRFGGLVAIQTASNSATIDFTGLSGSDDDYVLALRNVLPVTDDGAVNLRFSQGGSFKTDATYNMTSMLVNIAGGAPSTAIASSTSVAFQLTGGVNSAAIEGGACGEVELMGLSGTASYKLLMFRVQASRSTSGNQFIVGGGAYRGSAAAVDGLRLFMGSNIASGAALLYKKRKS
jgi:hypothetical protein